RKEDQEGARLFGPGRQALPLLTRLLEPAAGGQLRRAGEDDGEAPQRDSAEPQGHGAGQPALRQEAAGQCGQPGDRRGIPGPQPTFPPTCGLTLGSSGTASASASNPFSSKTIRAFSRIARLAVNATIASAIATSPWHRGSRCT